MPNLRMRLIVEVEGAEAHFADVEVPAGHVARPPSQWWAMYLQPALLAALSQAGVTLPPEAAKFGDKARAHSQDHTV